MIDKNVSMHNNECDKNLAHSFLGTWHIYGNIACTHNTTATTGSLLPALNVNRQCIINNRKCNCLEVHERQNTQKIQRKQPINQSPPASSSQPFACALPSSWSTTACAPQPSSCWMPITTSQTIIYHNTSHCLLLEKGTQNPWIVIIYYLKSYTTTNKTVKKAQNYYGHFATRSTHYRSFRGLSPMQSLALTGKENSKKSIKPT